MISLFRKIRQKLLQQNRITRYLAYAVGEILLVVIGILIALYFNNLNEEKNKQRDIDQLLVDIEEDLLFNYSHANSVLEFFIFQDSIAKLIAAKKLTKADYDASHKLSYYVTNWDYLIPNEKNLNQFVEAEKIVSKKLKPIINASKNLLLNRTVLEDSWSNLKNNIDDNHRALSSFPWFVKYDSISNSARLEYMLHDPTYQALALGYWSNAQNFYDKISRYRAQTIATLLTIKKYKYDYTDKEIIKLLQDLGMIPFAGYGCDIEPKGLKSLKPRRASELYGNFTNDTVRINITNNRGQEIIKRKVIPPLSFETLVSSEFFGIDGDHNTLVTVLDKNGNCVKKYGAIENGYLLIGSHD